jgi:transposase
MNTSCHRHDISDVLWSKLEPLLIGTSKTPGVSGKDNRKFINAVFWILRTGAPWRDLPESYGDWKNTHRRFCRWRDKGVWETILEALIGADDYEWLMIDASFVKAHHHAHGAVGGNQDIKRSKGGRHPRFILPWIRLVVRSESLSHRVQSTIAQKLLS